MNKGFSFNDTFDNFSFSESGRCLDKDIVKKLALITTCKLKIDAVDQKVIGAETCIGNISVDDSAFLNEFISPCETNINYECEVEADLKDSEDLFVESPEKKVDNAGNLNLNNLLQKDIDLKLTSIIEHDLNPPDKHIQINISVNDSVFINDLISPHSKTNFENNTNDCEKELSINSRKNVSETSRHSQYQVKSPNATQISEVQITPITSIKCNLSAWGLPESILQKYENRGITSMFEWQAQCLGIPNVLQNNSNLVYSAPTSAGKTLVAEILAMKTVLERHKKVLFILPFVSVVREKMFYFQDILGNTGIRVEGFMGSYNPPGGFQAVQVAVCTIEKANGIINRLLEESALADIGAVIVDEMHLLGDHSRGYLLELMLTKLQYMSVRYENIQIQIIGMSATLPNLDLLGKWLKAELFVTSFRPIPLYEQCLVGRELYNKNLQFERQLSLLPELETDTDNLLQLCLETIQNSCSVLVFCPTKNWCENLSQQIAMAFWKLGCSKSPFGLTLREQLSYDLIKEVLEQLRRCPIGLDKLLEKTVSYGVAFHHAGLTMDERDIIESAFRNGALRVLVATSTLSSGVNLPARRVIIRTPMFHGKPIDNLVYRQMIGRAGRMGRDSCGESILICQKTDHRIAKELLSAELQPIESCLEGAGRLKRAILEVVASGVAVTPDDIILFTNCTLLAVSENHNEDHLQSPIEEATEFLTRNEFIRLQKSEDGTTLKYIPTSLGKACLSSSMPPEEGLALFSELERARQCFVLETELHLIYTVTPYSVCNQWTNLDWLLFLELWEKLPASMKRVGELVGVRESYIINATRNKILTNTSKLHQKLQIHRRFYTALALQDLVNEISLNEVAVKFGCSRGMLQSLQQSASTFAGMLTIFSKQLGWSSMEILISQFQDRLQFGINRDLLDLMRLSILNGLRARALHNAGIETLAHLASASACDVENVLHKVVPFESEKEREGESEFEAHKRNKIRGIFVTGKEGLTEREAAVMLIQEARRYLQLNLGLSEAKWEGGKSNNSSQVVEESVEEQTKYNQSNLLTNDNKKENINIETPNLDVEETVGCGQKENIEMNASFKLKLSSDSPNRSSESINVYNSSIQFEKSQDRSELEESTSNVKSNEKLMITSDQSLFEDSFELNPCLTNSAVCRIEHKEIDRSESSTSTNVNSGDSGLDFENGSFLENAFMTTFDVESEELNDKISDVIDTSPNSDVSKNFSEMTLRKDERNCRNIDLSTSDHLICFKTPLIHRKRERANKENKSSIIDEDESYIEQTPTKKRRLYTKGNQDITYNASQSFGEEINCKLQNCIPIDLKKFHIVDVCNDKKLFNTFCEELNHQQIISLSFACKQISQNIPLIGANIVGNNIQEKTLSLKQFKYKDRQLVGLSITWGSNIAYFISFNNEEHISNTVKVEIFKKLFFNKTLKVRIFDCKEQMKIAKLCCGLDCFCATEDPKVGDWLIEPEGKEKNLQAMALKYAPEAVSLSQLAGNCKGVGSVGLDLYSSIEPRVRAAVEAIVTWHLCESLYDVLFEQNSKLLETYEVEMSSILCLTRMEINGIGVNMSQLQILTDDLKEQTGNIEKEAYSLAGHHFSFTSSKDVAKVLGMYKGKKVSTNKQTLEHCDHPIAKLILLWRKLNSTLTRMIYPLIRSVQNERIHGCCITYNSTGRISMHEPNLQNIPKDFQFESFDSDSKKVISCRKAFVPRSNFVFLSADYCQLELRLLTHFSQDPLLCSIMKSSQDVFKLVAAKWKNIKETKVDSVLRQWAKQLCYGIIYGMGTKALAEQLSVSEEEASKFMEGFHDCYPFIQKYVQEIISKCRELGYVETLAGRKRYLSHINDKNSAIRSQAERQAVNTTVQGSAADIAKKAMVLIDDRFHNKFRHPKNLPKLVLHLHDELLYEVPEKYLLKTAKILKQSMEEAVNLSIPFPVKLKSGMSWGNMQELVL